MSDHRSFAEVLRSEGGLVGCSEVLPYRGMHIGSALAARQPTILARISHILTVNGQPPLPPALLPAHVTCTTVDIEDDTEEDILQFLPVCMDAITAARAQATDVDGRPGGVLVHCTLGVSRSATICAAYIMITSMLPAAEALGIVRAARRWVRPNDGFMRQLEQLEGVLLRPAPAHPLPDPAANYLSARQGSPRCELCALRRTTTWHSHVHPLFVVVDCDSCSVPMLVVRGAVKAAHGGSWASLGAAFQQAALCELSAVADVVFGPGRWVADWHMRSIPDHAHAHARPRLFPSLTLPAPRL